MTLPPVLMLTDRHQLPSGRSLLEQVSRAVEAGIRAVVLRERDLDDGRRSDLAADVAALLDPARGVVILAAPSPEPARPVHLRADDPFPRDRPDVIGRSCHDRADVERARTEGVDYVVVGPVAPTTSKPGYGPALGPSGLHALTRAAAHPGDTGTALPTSAPLVYALGGVDADNAARWTSAGADGVAVMGALMRTADPASVAAALLAATARSPV